MPTLKHLPSAQAIYWQGKLLLLDAGEGVQLSLRANKIPFQKIEAVFISHMHGDHVLGLPGLIGSMNLLGRTKPLQLFGPEALKSYVKHSLELTHTHVAFPLEFHALSEQGNSTIYQWQGSSVESIPVQHRIAAFGFAFHYRALERNLRKDARDRLHLSRTELLSLKAGNQVQRPDGSTIHPDDACEPPKSPLRYVYSGDTAPCAGIQNTAQQANLLYHEATFLQEMSKVAKATGHSTAEQAAKLAREAGVKHLLLGHFSSRYRDETRLLNEASLYHPNVSLAHEGMRIRL